MSYQTALTIYDIVKDIHSKKYLLPAIQREFVWSSYQIETLFDSLMRDYPISSFLFWHVKKERSHEYEFYEFLREYHEKDKTHNPKANLNGEEDITAVLDGQQRLTSIYIALRGSYAYKLPRKRWDNPQAYPKRFLYLNLVDKSTDEDMEFDFQFITPEEATNDEQHYWFKVGDMLNMTELEYVTDYILNNITYAYDKAKAIFANKALAQLYKIIHTKPTISYYLEKSEKLDKVLNIFIRINSGGTVLSYSDLLLSIATAQWKTKDAREEILDFVDEINRIGDGFNFSKDFVLKSSLVLSGFRDIAFKVDNFNSVNMHKIEQNWDEIKQSVRRAVQLVASFGYSRETLTSNNAIIPIAYYFKHNGLSDSFITSTTKNNDRKNIKKWLVLSLIKKVFGGQADSILRTICDSIKNNTAGQFPLDSIINKFKGTNKTLIFTDEDIDNLTYIKYGQSELISVFSLLYPSFDFANKYHLDHIFPKSKFTEKLLIKKGVPQGEIEQSIFCCNLLANMQLLQAIPNIEKSDTDFDVWLKKNLSVQEIQKYKDNHYIPSVDLSFSNFLTFFQEREKLLIKALKKELSV